MAIAIFLGQNDADQMTVESSEQSGELESENQESNNLAYGLSTPIFEVESESPNQSARCKLLIIFFLKPKILLVLIYRL